MPTHPDANPSHSLPPSGDRRWSGRIRLAVLLVVGLASWALVLGIALVVARAVAD